MAKPRGRPFSPGNTVSTGRPPGSRNKATQAALELFSAHSEAVAKKCLVLAMQGDSTALRLSMERICPARSSMPLQFKLPKVQSLTDVPKAADAILQAVSSGQLTPEEGEQVMKLLKEYREILISADIVPRLEILEQR